MKQKFASLLQGSELTVLLEAHDAVSAVIAERAGLKALWASSLTISCANGYRDNNEMSMSQVLDQLETMTRRVNIPILADADTGHGSLERLAILAEGLWRRDVAGLCVEDKQFPKRNSLLAASDQRLETIDNFCEKLQAVRQCRGGTELALVARTESLILHGSIDDALGRSHAYVDAGADAILVHSKSRSFGEVDAFMQRWDNRAPVICVPTTYAETPISTLETSGISAVIWANHMLRASVFAMRSLANRVARHGHVRDIAALATVQDLFSLQEPTCAIDALSSI